MVSTRQMTTTTSSSTGSSSSSSNVVVSGGGSGSGSGNATTTSSASTSANDDISTAAVDLDLDTFITGIANGGSAAVQTSNGAAASSGADVSFDSMAASDAWMAASVVEQTHQQQQQQLAAQQLIMTSTAVAVPRPLSNGGAAGGSDMRRYTAGMAVRSRAMTRLRPTNLLDLPMEMLEEIFSYVGYKKVSQMRVVSKQMNSVCSAILNSTFSKLSTYLMNRFRLIKNNMPRRESSRRTHPLSYECDIVETCYMRVSLLQMTFGKHMDRKHICFFAGAILDEVFHILREIRNTPNIRPHTMTEELYDLSTMAMEYFKEHLEPRLPRLMQTMIRQSFVDHSKNNTKTKFLLDTSSGSVGGGSSGLAADSDAESSLVLAEDEDDIVAAPPQSNMVLRKGIRKIKQGMKRYNNQLTVLRNDLRYCKRKAADQHKAIGEMQKLIAEQQKQTVEYAARLDENDKKNEEMSMKISALLQESNKCKTELQYWRSTGRAAPANAQLQDGADLAPLADADLEQLAVAAAAELHASGAAAANAAQAAHIAPTDSGADPTAAGAAPHDGMVVIIEQVQIDGRAAAVSAVAVSSTAETTVTTAGLIVGGKRKADVAQLTDSGASSSSVSVISSLGGGGADGAAGFVTEAPPSQPLQLQQHQHHGSDIIKKARRVQSKARGQHPLSISSSSNSSSSSSSSNCGPLGGAGGNSSVGSANHTYVTSNIQSSGNNHSSNGASGAAGSGKFTRSK